MNPQKFGTAVNRMYEYNPTITEQKIPAKFGNDYVKYHRYLLTDAAIDEISLDKLPKGINKENIKQEMKKLCDAIETTKSEAKKLNRRNKFGEYSLESRWNVENCAEIWAARNAILKGAKFDNLIFKSVFIQSNQVHTLCENCKVTFKGHYIIE